MEESGAIPPSVALGIKGAWVAIWADRTRSWNLRNAYSSLVSAWPPEQRLETSHFAALNPCTQDEYFIVKEDGGCSYSVSIDKDEAKTIYEMTDTYMRTRAKRDGSTFSHSMTPNDVPKLVMITPSSNSQEIAADALIATLRGRLRSNGGLP
jgi:hypothetical protein